MASSKLNLHGGFFRKSGHLGLVEAKHTCVLHGLARYSFVCFRSKTISYGAGHSKFLKSEIGRISDFGRTSASQKKISYGTLETEN